MVKPPLPGTAAFNKANPSPSETLEQNQKAKREIARSSQDNLKACTEVLVQLEDLFVPQPFKPLGKKEGEGAIRKSSSTVVRTETSMETDAITAPEVCKPPVPSPCQPRQHDSNEPNLVDEAGMKKWSNDMLKGHPGGRASTWEQWGNSFTPQFKGAMDTMSHLLRIKEDFYIKMFAEKERIARESKAHSDKVKILEEKLASLTVPDDKVRKLETDNAFLQEKLMVSEEKCKKEIDSNLDLFSTIQMQMKSAREAPSEDTDEERRKFLTQSNCIELLNPVNSRGDTVYCMDALPVEILLYGPDGVMFVKTRQTKTVAMMMYV